VFLPGFIRLAFASTDLPSDTREGKLISSYR
jgi:hypothetical protein